MKEEKKALHAFFKNQRYVMSKEEVSVTLYVEEHNFSNAIVNERSFSTFQTIQPLNQTLSS